VNLLFDKQLIWSVSSYLTILSGIISVVKGGICSGINEFEINGSCRPMLTCSDFSKFEILDLIGVGAVKVVYGIKYEHHVFALSVLQNEQYIDDFKHGLNMLIQLNPSPLIVNLIGYCEREPLGIVTEYYKYNNAKNIFNITNAAYTIQQRLHFCINYVEILNYLHNKNLVFCDSNDLDKILEQILITDELKLVLNDVDALAVVQNNNITCGNRELQGDFIAPEQLWPYKNKPFDPSKMPGYNEKTDIWKIPDVCSFFLGNDKDSKIVQYHLYEIHKECKNMDPHNRPNAVALLRKYNTVLHYFEKEL